MTQSKSFKKEGFSIKEEKEKDSFNLITFLFTKGEDSQCPIRGLLGKPSNIIIIAILLLIIAYRFTPYL